MTRLIVYTVKTIAVIATLILWVFPIGLVWFALLLRTIAAYSIAVIATLYSGGGIPKEAEARLERIAGMWPRGFGYIIATLFTTTSPGALLKPQHPIQAVQDTILAIFFYMWLFVSWHWISQFHDRPYEILRYVWHWAVQWYKELRP